MKTKRPVGYLNVDLEIEASFSLEPLAKELEKTDAVLYCGPGAGKSHLLCLESGRWPDTPDATALALCSAIERLPVRGRKLWDRAKLKTFDVGYDLPSGARSVRVVLHRRTLERIVGLGATVAFSCYRANDCNPPDLVTANKPTPAPKRKSSSKPASRR